MRTVLLDIVVSLKYFNFSKSGNSLELLDTLMGTPTMCRQ